MNKELVTFLENEGNTHIVEKPNVGICSLHRFAFTTGLCYGLDYEGREGRYCYPNRSDAILAIKEWDGVGDPPDSNWVKHKGYRGEYNNPCHIRNIAGAYCNLKLECDGLTRVLSYQLYKNNIIHRVFSGFVTYKGKSIFHYWIVDEYGWYVDYRLRMWFGDGEKIPHGVFRTPFTVAYDKEVELPITTDENLIKILLSDEWF